MDKPSTHVPLGCLSSHLCSQTVSLPSVERFRMLGTKAGPHEALGALPVITRILSFSPLRTGNSESLALLLSLFCLTVPNIAFDFSGFLICLHSGHSHTSISVLAGVTFSFQDTSAFFPKQRGSVDRSLANLSYVHTQQPLAYSFKTV